MWLIILFICAIVVFSMGQKLKSNRLKILALIMAFLAFLMTLFYFNFKKEYAPSIEIEAKTDFYEIKAKYPVEDWDREGVMKNFVNVLVSEAKEDWKEGGDLYKQEQEMQLEFPDRGKMIYTLNIDFEKIKSKSRQSVSYLFRIYSYTGGANGNESIKTFTFNQARELKIDNIIKLAGFHNDKVIDVFLSELLLKNSQLNTDIFPDPELTKEGLGLNCLEEDGLTIDQEKCNYDIWPFTSNLENFAISDNGIIFFFNKCEITTCSSGPVGIMIDWKDLEPFMGKEEPVIEKAVDSEKEALLQSKEWQWIETQYNNDEVVKPKEEKLFSIDFNSEGFVSIKTDCNNYSGGYSIDGSKIQFSQILGNLMFCEGSQESEFVSMILEADSFLFDDSSNLVLNIKYDSGSIFFK